MDNFARLAEPDAESDSPEDRLWAALLRSERARLEAEHGHRLALAGMTTANLEIVRLTKELRQAQRAAELRDSNG